MGKVPQTVLEAAGREVMITNPDKVFFPQAGHTKLDLAKYMRKRSASKSRPPAPTMTISPSTTQRSGSAWARGARSSGK